ncbi:hypothetical protein GIB67_004502 [Kingdonia uniflora]|uniref:RGS domain-containing protein n=1 Tax=Kingdonia uniflora TaxID=39325 RepID=A0A7J7MRT0_9MAGN|nr:hypothetical protein GIB67_004502 [Kingdonia uniflora]
MERCALEGGCPSDYIAISISALSVILLLTQSALPFLIHKVPLKKGGDIWLLRLQIIASLNLLVSIVMSVNFMKIKKKHWWQACYIWAGWFEGPFGFGLLMSCRIIQAFKLYYLFVKRRLPPIRSYILLPLAILPWIAIAASVHIKNPLNPRCHMPSQWLIPVVSLHIFYVAVMVAITRGVRHIEFRFREFRDLLKGIIVSTTVIGVWVLSYILNEVFENIAWLQVSSRFFLLATPSILILAFYSISISQPLLSQMSLRKRDIQEFGTMSQALGIPESGLLVHKGPSSNIDTKEPLNKLLLSKTFRQSFMAFADSCLAGESVHFYDEVHELSKIPISDTVSRVYMARHIIENYIVAGAMMEVNISHRTRQEILNTLDLTHPELFDNATSELMQLMKTNLAKDYWSSMFYAKLKEKSSTQFDDYEFGLDFSPRLSSVRCADDPFHQEQPLKGSGRRSEIHHVDIL